MRLARVPRLKGKGIRLLLRYSLLLLVVSSAEEKAGLCAGSDSPVGWGCLAAILVVGP